MFITHTYHYFCELMLISSTCYYSSLLLSIFSIYHRPYVAFMYFFSLSAGRVLLSFVAFSGVCVCVCVCVYVVSSFSLLLATLFWPTRTTPTQQLYSFTAHSRPPPP